MLFTLVVWYQYTDGKQRHFLLKHEGFFRQFDLRAIFYLQLHKYCCITTPLLITISLHRKFDKKKERDFWVFTARRSDTGKQTH